MDTAPTFVADPLAEFSDHRKCAASFMDPESATLHLSAISFFDSRGTPNPGTVPRINVGVPRSCCCYCGNGAHPICVSSRPNTESPSVKREAIALLLPLQSAFAVLWTWRFRAGWGWIRHRTGAGGATQKQCRLTEPETSGLKIEDGAKSIFGGSIHNEL